MMNISEIPEYFCLIVTEVKKFAVYGIRPGSIIYCRKSFRKNDDGIYVYFKNGNNDLFYKLEHGYTSLSQGRVRDVFEKDTNADFEVYKQIWNNFYE